jgi:hypothetical protein
LSAQQAARAADEPDDDRSDQSDDLKDRLTLRPANEQIGGVEEDNMPVIAGFDKLASSMSPLVTQEYERINQSDRLAV